MSERLEITQIGVSEFAVVNGNGDVISPRFYSEEYAHVWLDRVINDEEAEDA